MYCFKINNWNVEKEHIKQVFSDGGCYSYPTGTNCPSASDFYGSVSQNQVYVKDYSDSSECSVYADGSVECT